MGVLFFCKFQRSQLRYIRRYTRCLSIFCSAYKEGNMLLALDIDYLPAAGKWPKELTQEHIDLIKKFIKEIIYEQRLTHEVVLHYQVKNDDGKEVLSSCRVSYTRQKPLEPALVPITNQLECIEAQLNIFRKGRVENLIQDTQNRQLAKYVQKGENVCMFIAIQFDWQYSPPWDGINAIKGKIYGKDQNVIIKDVTGWV